MTIIDFNKQNPENKSEILWELGSVIGEKNKSNRVIALFSLFDFFVELHFSENADDVIDIRAISPTKLRRNGLFDC